MTAEELVQQVIDRLQQSLDTDFMTIPVQEILTSSVTDLQQAKPLITDG